MANIFCETGWLKILDDVVAGDLLFRIHLYKNNYIPVFSDVVANYTEADFNGYPGSTLLAWGIAFVNGSSQGEIDATPITWTRSGGATSNTIYGIYVTDSAGDLCYAERFPAPVLMNSVGDFITYNPKATLINQ